MIRALELLFALGAIDESGYLTHPLGNQMAELPLPPMHAKALISSPEFECSSEIVSILAMIQIKDFFVLSSQPGAKHKLEVSRRSFSVEEGDHMTMLNIYSGFVQVLYLYKILFFFRAVDLIAGVGNTI